MSADGPSCACGSASRGDMHCCAAAAARELMMQSFSKRCALIRRPSSARARCVTMSTCSGVLVVNPSSLSEGPSASIAVGAVSWVALPAALPAARGRSVRRRICRSLP
eukprot:2586271-Pyramimonas_sp.AAC.1